MHLLCPAPPKDGEKLGFQLVRSYGDDPRKGELTRAWLGHTVQTSNHWSSIPTSYAILDRVIVPHLLKVKRELPLRDRVRALRATGRIEDLRCIVTENDVAWSDGLLERFEPLELLTGSLEALSAQLVAAGDRDGADTQAVDTPFLTLRRGEGPA